MIICVCRNIKESDFETREELIQRIMELDHRCGQCQEYCQQLKELLNESGSGRKGKTPFCC